MYVGTESRRATTLVNGAGTASTLTGGGVSTLDGISVVSLGILPQIEGTVMLPVYRSRSLDESDVGCGELGLEACEPSQGVGTTDLGGVLSAGRSGGLGREGLWSAHGELGYRYRFPNAYEGEAPLPGSELLGGVEALLGPSTTWMVGPVAYALSRPQGFDLEDADLTSAERYVGLSATNMQAGGNDLLPGRGSLDLNRGILAALAVVTVAIAWSPPTLVLILGQLGVYGLVAVSVPLALVLARVLASKQELQHAAK